MPLPESRPLIINTNEPENGTNVNDVLTWNGTSWESAAPVAIVLPAAVSGQVLSYNGTSWEGSNSILGTTITNTTGSVLSIASNKTLKCDNTLTIQGTDGTTITFPTINDTLVGIDNTQTLINKTITQFKLTPETTPTGSTGMIYYDSTENLFKYYNGTFWISICKFNPVSIQLANLILSSNNGIFYAIPVIIAFGLMNSGNNITTSTLQNGWSASGQLTSEMTTSAQNITSTLSEIDNYIQYTYPSQPAGVYSIIFTAISRENSAIITLSEITSGITIAQVDLYRNTTTIGTGSQFEFQFMFNGINGADAEIKIRWTAASKNVASLGYNIRLSGYIQLTRYG